MLWGGPLTSPCFSWASCSSEISRTCSQSQSWETLQPELLTSKLHLPWASSLAHEHFPQHTAYNSSSLIVTLTLCFLIGQYHDRITIPVLKTALWFLSFAFTNKVWRVSVCSGGHMSNENGQSVHFLKLETLWYILISCQKAILFLSSWEKPTHGLQVMIKI